MNANFGEIFKLLRVKAGIPSLAELNRFLADNGYLFEDSILSHWQANRRVPRREVILCISAILLNCNPAISFHDINTLLESAGQGFLTEIEKVTLLRQTAKTAQYNKGGNNLRQHKSLVKVANSSNLVSTLEAEIPLLYIEIYKYPEIAYERIDKVINFIMKTHGHLDKRLLSFIARLKSMQIRCLTDMSSPIQFLQAEEQSKEVSVFTKECHPNNIGFQYWADAAVKRLKYVTSNRYTRKELLELLDELQLAIQYTSLDASLDLFVQYLELAKVGLLLYDKEIFERNINKAVEIFHTISTEYKFLGVTFIDNPYQMMRYRDRQQYKGM